MKGLRLSTQPNMHPRRGLDFSKSLCEGIAFYKSLGFDALDFPLYALDFSSGDWEKTVQDALLSAERADIRF